MKTSKEGSKKNCHILFNIVYKSMNTELSLWLQAINKNSECLLSATRDYLWMFGLRNIKKHKKLKCIAIFSLIEFYTVCTAYI